jgi:metal-responsive CopG/Arc/MetJ family transcriptional regulator
MKPTTMRFTKDMLELLDKVIAKTGISGRSNHVRRAIYDYCKRILND